MGILDQRTDAFKVWCWRRHLKSPLDCKKIKPVNLKEVNPEYSLERWTLKLKFQYFGHLIQAADSLENTLMLGKIEDKRRGGQQRMKWLDSITDSMEMNLSKLGEIVEALLRVWHVTVHGIRKNQARLNDWTTI